MAITEIIRNGVNKGRHYEEDIGSGANGTTLKISPMGLYGQTTTVTLIAGSGTGKFQVTTSSDAKIAAGTAVWQDWSQGNKTGTVSDSLNSPVTGIRGVSVSGAISIEIVV